MRYTPAPASLFIKNRQKFTASMQPGAGALFFSNEFVPHNADAAYKFTQNSNFYYLTGIDQEDCALFLFPDAPLERLREVLFVRKTSPQIQVWEGWKYSPEEATEASGIRTVMYLDQLEDFFLRHLNLTSGLYMEFNEHERNRLYIETPSHRWAHRLQREFPAQPILRATPQLHRQRMHKEPEEITQLKEACRITELAFREVLGFVRPGVMEYEVEALISYVFLQNRASGHAYEPIIASGPSGCVLHYNINDKRCEDSHLLLMDFGAKYALYSADLSRTIPVSGRFTPRQRQVYEAVYRVHQAATQRLVPGTLMIDYVKAAEEHMTEELLALGLITSEEVRNQDPQNPAFRRYFMHGLSHHLGLDTHDVNRWYEPFAPGMVFTVEPGIYIPEEGFGIRLENDVHITAHGPEDLMANIPLKADDIEQLMAAR
ncbi:MAG: aminopeptidase P N-terminal domain-containing protein [Bacteroidetes bacterium]|nr:aminopeptidase P N-terminal domain-containing protein [Bacteroidota bacterium]